MDYICIYSNADRERVRAVVEALRRAGIMTVLFPSDRGSDRWDVEVASDEADHARETVAAMLHVPTA